MTTRAEATAWNCIRVSHLGDRCPSGAAWTPTCTHWGCRQCSRESCTCCAISDWDFLFSLTCEHIFHGKLWEVNSNVPIVHQVVANSFCLLCLLAFEVVFISYPLTCICCCSGATKQDILRLGLENTSTPCKEYYWWQNVVSWIHVKL